METFSSSPFVLKSISKMVIVSSLAVVKSCSSWTLLSKNCTEKQRELSILLFSYFYQVHTACISLHFVNIVFVSFLHCFPKASFFLSYIENLNVSHLQIDLLKIVTKLKFCMNQYTSLAEHSLWLSDFFKKKLFILIWENNIENFWSKHLVSFKKCVKVHACYDNPK